MNWELGWELAWDRLGIALGTGWEFVAVLVGNLFAVGHNVGSTSPTNSQI
jgi:hypothetical protein